jgi:hypothetical protein
VVPLARTAGDSKAWCVPDGMADPTTAPVSIAADTPLRTASLAEGAPLPAGQPVSKIARRQEVAPVLSTAI